MYSKFVIGFVVLIHCAFVCAGRPTVPTYVTDPNAPMPTVKPPGQPGSPWHWSEAVDPHSIPAGAHVWVGAYNTYDPNRIKELWFLIQGWQHHKWMGQVAVGHDPNGAPVNGGFRGNPQGTYHDGLDPTRLWKIRFEHQPDWETFKLVNTSANWQSLSKMQIIYWCFEGLYNYVDSFTLRSASIGHEAHPLGITQLLVTHDTAPLNALVAPTLVPAIPGDTWVSEFVSMSPWGDPIPHGAWQWTCISGDGIAPAELFDLTFSVKACLPEGECQVYAYDELSGEWLSLSTAVTDYTTFPGDLTRDCRVNLEDFASFAKHWLETAEFLQD